MASTFVCVILGSVSMIFELMRSVCSGSWFHSLSSEFKARELLHGLAGHGRAAEISSLRGTVT
jgi:hypothetical protein